MSQSQKAILDRAFGRPAMMAFMGILLSYLVSGQVIPGWF
tara:strand:+ start:878 stop:997 length:120 start_codon:yes stop_codon:yes gene_type:complete